MLQEERYNDILRLLQAHKSITVKELCAALYTSPATIRRDLTVLEERGLLRRSYGGAVLCETFPDQIPASLRATEHLMDKKRIASKAAQWVHPGDTVFIDASSTTQHMAPFLHGIPDITVITNNPYLSIALSEQHIRNFCTGGETLFDSIACIGSWAERFIRGIRAQSFFFSARGICDGIITDSSKGERDIKLAMLECSKHHYLLAHSSKHGQIYPYVVTESASLDAIIDEK